jgi:phosphoglycerate-specific signal transduction histidine kinase
VTENLVKTDKKVVKIGQNWSKLVKIGQNWSKLVKIGQNDLKIGQND